MAEQSHVGGTTWPIAASVLAFIAGLWMVLSPLLGHMGPPWPCVVAGAVVIAGAAMLHQRPAQHTGWGVTISVVSGGILLLGQGGVLPGIIGVIGGIAAIVWRPEAERT